MSDARKLILGVGIWVIGITGLNLAINFSWSVLLNYSLPENQRKLYA